MAHEDGLKATYVACQDRLVTSIREIVKCLSDEFTASIAIMNNLATTLRKDIPKELADDTLTGESANKLAKTLVSPNVNKLSAITDALYGISKDITKYKDRLFHIIGPGAQCHDDATAIFIDEKLTMMKDSKLKKQEGEDANDNTSLQPLLSLVGSILALQALVLDVEKGSSRETMAKAALAGFGALPDLKPSSSYMKALAECVSKDQ